MNKTRFLIKLIRVSQLSYQTFNFQVEWAALLNFEYSHKAVCQIFDSNWYLQ